MAGYSPSNPADLQVIIDRIMAFEGSGEAQGLRACYGPGGSGGTWDDNVTFWGTPADLVLQGSAAFDGSGDFLVLDGTAGCYLATSSSPDPAPDFSTNVFAGAVGTPGCTINRNGITFGCIAKFDESDAAGLLARGAVFWQWHTGTYQKKMFRIQPGTGYLEIWLASDVQGGVGTESYQTDPRSKPDRFVTIQKNIWPFLLKGRPVPIQISRGTWGIIAGRPSRAEHTAVMIDNVVYWDSGTGNGIGNFIDCTTEFSIGLAQATPIIVPSPEAMYANLECELYACWFMSRFFEIYEMAAVVAGFFPDQNANTGLGTRLGFGL